MTGRIETLREWPPRGRWLAHLAGYERRFLLVDGGAAARLLVRLRSVTQRLRPVASARHAELLVLVEPVSRKLTPSILDLYTAMPRPRAIVIVGTECAGLRDADLVRAEEVFFHAQLISASLPPAQIAARMLVVPLRFDEAPRAPQIEPITVRLPGKLEREIATEPVVLSLGPVQPLTAGPLRLLLIADGEQIVSVIVEAGYAARNVAQTMSRVGWAEAARLSSLIDPLAPAAGRLAYVTALEKLRRSEPDESVRRRRSATLAFERAQNHIVWLVRFAELLGDRRLSACALRLDSSLAEASSAAERAAPPEWIARSSNEPFAQADFSRRIESSFTELVALCERLRRDRALALRSAGIGVLSPERLRAAGVTGPVLRASERGRGDVLSRLLTRLSDAADDLRQIAASPDALRPVDQEADANSPMPRGETEVAVEGPRGRIGLGLASDGESLVRVEWQRPSAALLRLLPELLAKQKLSDAEVIVASLDLAMAEADG